MPTLFSFPECSHVGGFLSDLPGLKPGQFSIVRYPNRELHVSIQSAVSGEHCLVLGSIAPPESQMASLLLLAHTLRKEGADRAPCQRQSDEPYRHGHEGRLPHEEAERLAKGQPLR